MHGQREAAECGEFTRLHLSPPQQAYALQSDDRHDGERWVSAGSSRQRPLIHFKEPDGLFTQSSDEVQMDVTPRT